jgi:hypothetical protein
MNMKREFRNSTRSAEEGRRKQGRAKAKRAGKRSARQSERAPLEIIVTIAWFCF